MSTTIRKKKSAAAHTFAKKRTDNYLLKEIRKKLQEKATGEDYVITKSKGGFVVRSKDTGERKGKKSKSTLYKNVATQYLTAVENLFKADHVDTETAAATVRRTPSSAELSFYSSIFRAKQ